MKIITERAFQQIKNRMEAMGGMGEGKATVVLNELSKLKAK